MNYIHKHKPLLTSKIEFTLVPPRPLPSITPRIEFTAERLALSDQDDPANDRQSLSPEPEIARRHGRGSDKIMKPAGEPGRPKSGGYCVETVLITGGWAKQDVQDLTVCRFSLIHLTIADACDRTLFALQLESTWTWLLVIEDKVNHH
jgi:hypothetical protein